MIGAFILMALTASASPRLDLIDLREPVRIYCFSGGEGESQLLFVEGSHIDRGPSRFKLTTAVYGISEMDAQAIERLAASEATFPWSSPDLQLHAGSAPAVRCGRLRAHGSLVLCRDFPFRPDLESAGSPLLSEAAQLKSGERVVVGGASRDVVRDNLLRMLDESCGDFESAQHRAASTAGQAPPEAVGSVCMSLAAILVFGELVEHPVESDYVDVRFVSVSKYAQGLPSPHTVTALSRLLDDASPRVRVSAAAALAVHASSESPFLHRLRDIACSRTGEADVSHLVAILEARQLLEECDSK